MSLRHELDRYLTVRRSPGYKLGTAERILRRFVDHAEAEQGGPDLGGLGGGLRSGPALLRKSISSYRPNQPVIIEFCQRERC